MRLIHVLVVMLLCAIAQAGCASWALRKMSSDFTDCMNGAGSNALAQRRCLRDWKYSLGDTDCLDDKFKALFTQFCEFHNGGVSICTF